MNTGKTVNILLLLMIFLLQSAKTMSAEAGITWLTGFVEAGESAKKQGKMIMVYFFGAKNQKSKEFEQQILSDPDVRRFSKDFVCVKIDGDENKKAMEKYSVTGYPTILFLDSVAEEINRISGFIRTGEALTHRMKALLSAHSKKKQKTEPAEEKNVEEKEEKNPEIAELGDFEYAMDTTEISIANNGKANIAIKLSGIPALVAITVMDNEKNAVRKLVNEKKSPGEIKVQWDGTDDKGKKVSTGNYTVELKIGTLREELKIQVSR